MLPLIQLLDYNSILPWEKKEYNFILLKITSKLSDTDTV